MNRLKEFLQVEVRRSYKYIITASAALKTIEKCLIAEEKFRVDEDFDNNFIASEITIDGLIEHVEEYLKINY